MSIIDNYIRSFFWDWGKHVYACMPACVFTSPDMSGARGMRGHREE